MENPETNRKVPSHSLSSSSKNKRVRTPMTNRIKRRSQKMSKLQEVMMTRERAANPKMRRLLVMKGIGSHSAREGSRLCPRRRLRRRDGRPRPRQMCISHRRPREWPPKPVQNHPSPAVQLHPQLTPRLQSVPWPLLSRIEEWGELAILKIRHAPCALLENLPRHSLLIDTFMEDARCKSIKKFTCYISLSSNKCFKN